MIELINIDKVYKQKKDSYVTALKQVSLKFDDTGLVFVVGEKETGKSTLLNLIGSLDSFNSGDILINNKSITKFRKKEIRNYRKYDVGFIYDENNLFDNYTVYKNIELVLDLQNASDKENKIKQILNDLELNGIENKYPYELSNEQKQKVALAKVLIKNPKVILCDESTKYLNNKNEQEYLELLQKISKNILVIVTTNNNELATSYGNRVIGLKDGEVISDETLKTIDKNDKKEFMYDKAKTKPNTSIMKTKTKISFSLFKKNPIRLLFACLFSILCLVSIALNLMTNSLDMPKLLIETALDNDVSLLPIEKTIEVPNKADHQLIQLLDSDISLIESNINANRIDKLYRGFFDLSDCFGMDSTKAVASMTNNAIDYYNLPSFLPYWCEIDKDFVNDYQLTYIGRLPTNNNEVMITNYEAERFKRFTYKYNGTTELIDSTDSLLNKKLQLNKNMEPFTIVGILDTKLNNERYEILKTTPDNEDPFRCTVVGSEIEEILRHGNLHHTLYLNKGFYQENVDTIVTYIVGAKTKATISTTITSIRYGKMDIIKTNYGFVSTFPDASLIYTKNNRQITSLGEKEMLVPFDFLEAFSTDLWDYSFSSYFRSDVITSIEDYAKVHFDEIKDKFLEAFKHNDPEATTYEDYANYIFEKTYGMNNSSVDADNYFHPGMTSEHFEREILQQRLDDDTINLDKLPTFTIKTSASNDVYESYKAVGIIYYPTTDRNSPNDVIVNKNLIYKIFDTMDYDASIVDSLIIPATKNYKDFKNQLDSINNLEVIVNNKDKITYETNNEFYYTVETAFDVTIDIRSNFFIFVSVVLGILSIAAISYYLLGIFKSKKKQFAMLETLGLSKASIISTFIFEYLFMFLLISIIAAPIGALLVSLINPMVVKSTFLPIELYNYTISQAFIVVFVALGLITLGFITPIIYFLKTKPILNKHLAK